MLDENRVIRNLYPHYTDTRFKTAQTVYGCQKNGLMYEYDDRLQQWDNDKHQESVEVAKNSDAESKTARWFEVYLSHYHHKPVELCHIMSGVNLGNGYPYVIFGFKYIEGDDFHE